MQCIPIAPGSYVARASILVPTQANPPFPSVSVGHYSDTECFDFLGDDTAFWTGEVDVWQDLEFAVTVPPGAVAVGFRPFSGNR